MEPDRARQLLQRERERVEAELASLRAGRGDGDDELSRVDQHSADAATDLFDTERDHSLIDRLEHDLAAIERAEARLAEGSYGVSVESGEPIPDGRLEVVPWAERTAEEQARYEGGS